MMNNFELYETMKSVIFDIYMSQNIPELTDEEKDNLWDEWNDYDGETEIDQAFNEIFTPYFDDAVEDIIMSRKASYEVKFELTFKGKLIINAHTPEDISMSIGNDDTFEQSIVDIITDCPDDSSIEIIEINELGDYDEYPDYEID